MTKGVRRSLLARFLVAATTILAIAGPLVAEDFYEEQLRLGKADMLAGRVPQASDELRISAFGFLDRPPLLVEALVRLTLAQSTLSQSSAVSQTLNRLLEVERRFPAYASAAIEPQNRAAFEALLLKNIARSDLTGIPAFARLIRSEAARVADLPVERRTAAYEAGFRRSSKDIEWPLEAARDAAARGLDDDTIRWAKRAVAIAPGHEAAQLLLAHATARRGDCKTALTQIAAFPAGVLQSHVELLGDQVVCLAKQSRWSEADAAAAKLPDGERSRSDVARALQDVNARKNPALPKSVPVGGTAVVSNPAGRPPASTGTSAPASSSGKSNGTGSDPASTPGVTRPPSAKSTDVLAAGKALVQKGSFAEATKLLQPAVAVDPTNRDLRLALLEAAFLSRDWRIAVSQVPAAAPFKSGEEASMFYAGAALYESGRNVEARQMMERARPQLPSTPLVDYYLRLVLGNRAR
jgi:tetratricopeptide (TPR) repeat protein